VREIENDLQDGAGQSATKRRFSRGRSGNSRAVLSQARVIPGVDDLKKNALSQAANHCPARTKSVSASWDLADLVSLPVWKSISPPPEEGRVIAAFRSSGKDWACCRAKSHKTLDYRSETAIPRPTCSTVTIVSVEAGRWGLAKREPRRHGSTRGRAAFSTWQCGATTPPGRMQARTAAHDPRAGEPHWRRDRGGERDTKNAFGPRSYDPGDGHTCATGRFARPKPIFKRVGRDETTPGFLADVLPGALRLSIGAGFTKAGLGRSATCTRAGVQFAE